MADESIVLLSDLVGSRVVRAPGGLVGTVRDLVIAQDPRPRIRDVVVRLSRGEGISTVPWSAIAADGGDFVITPEAVLQPLELQPDELLLVRDVLDTQVVDLGGKRFARVSEVLLVREGHHLEVLGVDISPAGLWRRLGFRGRAGRMTERAIAWPDLHLTSERGHAVHLATNSTAVHRLAPAELALLLEHLHPEKAQQVIGALPAVEVSALEAHHRAHPHRRRHALRPFARIRRRHAAPR